MASLDTIYRNQLGRAPDAGGLAHYQAQLAAGRSIDDIRQEIANSPEAKSRGVGAYKPYQAPDINTLSAHEYNKIRTSLDKYKATQTKPAGGFDSRYERTRFDMAGREAEAARKEFKSGKDYGIEDEYRYMVSQGFRPGSIQQTQTNNNQQSAQNQQVTTTPATVTNPYQSQIDELTGQLGTISGQIGGYTDTIDTLRGQISTMQTDFASQLQGIMAANTKALEGMSAQYQQQLTAQQEAQERARKERELAAQTAAANQARAGQQAQFQIGSSSMPGALLGGLAGFKRRGEIKAATSDALSIAGNGKKSPNKMLNV